MKCLTDLWSSQLYLLLEKTTKEHREKKGNELSKIRFFEIRDKRKEKKREGIIVSITRLSFVWLPLLFRDGTSCLVVSLKEHLLLPLRKRRRSLAVKMDPYYTNRLCSLGPMALFSKVLICSSKCFETGFPGPISKKVVRIPEKLCTTRERTCSVGS